MAKDRKIDMVILGVLSHERSTGYDIKKKIDGGISYFWKGSFGSIYPALTAMEKEGLVSRYAPEGQSGKREKIYYEITDAGKQTLLDWLNEDKVTNDLKYETVLKLFFGGVANPEVSIKTIENFESEITNSLAVLKGYEEVLSAVLDEPDHVYYYLTVLFGIETYEGYLSWCKNAKALIRKQLM